MDVDYQTIKLISGLSCIVVMLLNIVAIELDKSKLMLFRFLTCLSFVIVSSLLLMLFWYKF